MQASLPPVPSLVGLKLSYLLDDENGFLKLCGGREKLRGKSTEEVNRQFQKEFTKSEKLSFCDYLTQQGHSAVGKATVFISHAWIYLFLDVLDALKDHFSFSEPGYKDVVIWFDIFSVNQHQVITDTDWWISTFKSAIQQFARTVMVLSPWNNPVTLTRGWCLFEIYCTIIAGKTFEVAMTKGSSEEFLRDITSDAEKSINKMSTNIDVKNSKCGKKEDRDSILTIVRNEVGFDIVNSMIFECMRTWVIETAEKAKIKDPNNLGLLISLAKLYSGQGQYAKAEPLFKSCYERKSRSGVSLDATTLTAMYHLGVLYFDWGRYADAKPLLENCFRNRVNVLGVEHPDTISSKTNLAKFYFYTSQSNFGKAEEVLKDCLATCNRVLGEENALTLTTMHSLGDLYYKWGKFELARPMLEKCLVKRGKILRKLHPDTLASMKSLGALFSDMGEFDKADNHLKGCLKRRRIALGEHHPSILTTMHCLGNLYLRWKKYKEAEPHFVTCLEGRCIALGDKHQDSVHTKESLKALRKAMKEYTYIRHKCRCMV